MNPPTLEEGKKIFGLVEKNVSKAKATIVLCPPNPFLLGVREPSRKKSKPLIKLGAQNVASEKTGPFTGEVSAPMLREVGAEYVIVGHSERRSMGETNTAIGKKVTLALKEGLSVVLCVGEQSRDEHGEYIHVLERQVTESFPQVPRKALDRLIIAYEPVWAIGEAAQKAATPTEVFESVILIRKILSQIAPKEFALKAPLLYGGSVDPTNAREFMEKGGVQGLLVGRDSRDPKNFALIIKEVDAAA